MTRRDDLLREIEPWIERARAFSGWDFPDIRPRDLEPGPPWDYGAIVRGALASSRAVLDLGTGGAEFFAQAAAGFQGRMAATEAWHVNAPIARDRLAPLGGHVVRADAEYAIPFGDGAFDLIIDRHEAVDPDEVARVLARGGRFITQQVGNDNWRELDVFFTRAEFGDHYTRYQEQLRERGLAVEARQHRWRIAYASIGEIVFMLLVAPWEVPGFDPVAQLDQLLAFEESVRTANGIEMTFDRYLLNARKPA